MIRKIEFSDIIKRSPNPKPWSEADNIPWNDPAFSGRMLREHLNQEHDAASRRFEKIDQHINWIHQSVLMGKTSKILDLGCGPGLYTTRLAKLGHQVRGIDYSPASIIYARETAEKANLDCSFLEADIRLAPYADDYDAIMLIYGEFNIFKPKDIQTILKKSYQALKPGGLLILEPHTFKIIHEMGKERPFWHSSLSGVYANQPYIVLQENSWIENHQVTHVRYYVIKSEDGSVLQYSQSFQAYTKEGYTSLLEKNGYTHIQIYPSLTGKVDPDQPALFAILARKSGLDL